MERRTFLVLGIAALGLAGCTSSPGPTPDGPVSSAPPDDPDVALRDRVATAELALIAAYTTAVGDHPELAEQVTPFLAHHQAHLSRIAPERATASASTTASPMSPSPTGTAAPTSPHSSPDDTATGTSSRAAPSAALAALADAESAARRARIADCDAARDASLARTLALIAASEAQHATVLDSLAREAS